ncbi:helix-turn-helix transcriptional regulator [Mechercharimyces sp. CAU 1602]|uniref:helix-turn-helix transcriptional regulator n=1 Tax=Mechercharimyces sp. CAU 1602 TaxID=2973933 RepID=UPI002867B940|nr:helix-turn-helix transcriptional regulator [Mechercharimyces sp. CAU 1602]
MMLVNRLKELRAKNGWSQTVLAQKISVSRQTISLIERGDYHPSIVLSLRIAHAFDVTVEEVFTLTEEE